MRGSMWIGLVSSVSAANRSRSSAVNVVSPIVVMLAAFYPRSRYPRRMGNTWGQLFRVTTWGESHGGAIGAVVDGCPPRIALSEADVQVELDRRRPGQSALVTQRKESDAVAIVSGVYEGMTLGTPIGMTIAN